MESHLCSRLPTTHILLSQISGSIDISIHYNALSYSSIKGWLQILHFVSLVLVVDSYCQESHYEERFG